MATIYLNNITKSTVNWSIDFDSKNIVGDQEGLAFNPCTVEFAQSYTVCYWTDPGNRYCVSVTDDDAVTYTGDGVIHTMSALGKSGGD